VFPDNIEYLRESFSQLNGEELESIKAALDRLRSIFPTA
jgi:hypothetical protein